MSTFSREELQQRLDAAVDHINRCESRAAMCESVASAVIAERDTFRAQRDLLAIAARDFVAKVDKGRARSVDSYRKFTEALESL